MRQKVHIFIYFLLKYPDFDCPEHVSSVTTEKVVISPQKCTRLYRVMVGVDVIVIKQWWGWIFNFLSIIYFDI